MKYSDKKILIISHNPLSKINNNGKTLVSIFKGVPDDNIYQIYLNSEIPDYCGDCHFLQINELQIINSILKGKNFCCSEVKPENLLCSSASIKKHVFANHFKRLMRECVWKYAIWKSKLNDWLKDKEFDVVFFMAGDGLFAYDVYTYIKKQIPSAKGCLFFTDDYIIGKTSYSPFALLRQFLLKKKIKKTLRFVDELYVISNEMSKAYKKILGYDSYIIQNFSVERKNSNNITREDDTGCLTMVYAGGLHYNRWKVISQIAQQLKELNDTNDIKCYLKIYSSQDISKDIVKQLHIRGASEFLGGAPASDIADIYANADILLHVESFDKKAIASTKYSFSTKIPEYLSANKCVLAVGPKEVASIRYLADISCVINDCNDFSIEMLNLINNDIYREQIQINCSKYFERDFSQRKQIECLQQILS